MWLLVLKRLHMSLQITISEPKYHSHWKQKVTELTYRMLTR